MRALILIDLQKDFFPKGALAVKNGDQIIPVVNRLLDCDFDWVVATKDWHPNNHGSFASVHGKVIGESIELEGVEQILWPTHCVQETKGAEFAPGWDSSKVDKVFYKGSDQNIDSYSSFFDNAHLRSTGLGDFLKMRGVDTVFLAGLATDYCVKFSAMDALQLGFKTYVIVDGCRGVDLREGDSAKALQEMVQEGAHLIHSDEIAQGSEQPSR